MGRTVFLATLFQTIPSITGVTQLLAFFGGCYLAHVALRPRR